MERVRYEVDLSGRLQHLVHVRMTVPADLSSGALLTVPTWTPGSYVERNYVHHLQSYDATDAHGATVQLRREGHTSLRLPDDVAGPVTVDLEWYANTLTVRTNHVDDHHALLVPPATFPFVDGATDRPIEVTITPTEGHHVWGLLPTADGEEDGRTEVTTYLAEDHLHLVDSAFEIADVPVHAFDVDGIEHRWVHASHGGHIDLGRIEDDVREIARQAAAVFGGPPPIERYTFLCVGGAESDGTGGLEHRDGSVLMLPALTDSTEAGVRRTRSLIAHEYFHLWNVKRLVPADLLEMTLDRPTHTSELWVAEGWTAYYDDLLPVRADLETPRTYLDTLRDNLLWVQRTPGAQRQSVLDASWNAWTGLYVRDENSVNSGTSYYTHGAVLAACLDLLIRAEAPDGDGLDDAMRLLWQRFGHPCPTGYPSRGYTHDDVVTALSDAAGRDLTGFVQDHVETATPPPLVDLLDAVGLHAELDDPEQAVELGVQVTQSGEQVTAAAVLRDGPAWRGGVTGGDVLLAVDGTVVERDRLDRVLAGYAPADEVLITVLRGHRLLELSVTLGAAQPKPTFSAVDDASEAQRTAFARWTGHPLSEV